MTLHETQVSTAQRAGTRLLPSCTEGRDTTETTIVA